MSPATAALRRRALVFLLGGAAVGELLNVAFDLFRYGTLLNYAYLDQPRSSHAMAALNAIALVLSPNGGIVWFWPGVGVALGVLVFRSVRPVGTGSKGVRGGSLVALVAFALFALGLGLWWDPFGWYAWGPRLLMPAGAPIIVLAVASISQARLSRAWTSASSLISLSVAGILALVPTLGAVFDNGNQQTSMEYVVWARRPECTQVMTEVTQSLRDSCLRSFEWLAAAPPLVKSVPTSFHAHHEYWATLIFAGIAISLWAIRGHRRASLIDDELPSIDEMATSDSGSGTP